MLMTFSLNLYSEPNSREKKNRDIPRKTKTQPVLHHFILFHSLGPHDSPPKELADKPKPVLTALQFALEQVMLLRRLYLPLPDALDPGVLRCTHRAFRVLVDLI